MLRKTRTIVLCVAGLTCLGWNPARAATYPLVGFTDLQGIIVRSIHQDSRGVVWLATDCGLWRWNRDGFEPLRTCVTGAARCLVEDDNATLWVGTPDGLVGVDIGSRVGLDPPYSLESRVDRRMLLGTDIRRLYRDPRGRIWCGTFRGLYRLDCTREGCTATLVEGTEAYEVASIAAGPTGDLWVGAKGALLHVLDGSMDPLFESIIGASTVDALLQASDGSLWMGLRNDGGLYRIVEGRPVRLTRKDGLPNDEVNAIVEAPSGEIWVATEHGVHRSTGGGFTPISRRTGLENEDVHALIFDREEQVWIGTYGGGVYLLRTPHVLTYGLDDGVPHPVVTALARDSTGELVVGTIEGAAHFAPDGAPSRAHRSGRHVRAEFLDHAGALWIGGPAGVWRLDDLTLSASVHGVFSLGEDADGRLLVGATHGLWRFEGPHAKRLELPRGFSGAVRAILRSRDGWVYLGTAQGLVRGRDGSWDLAAEDLEINALCEDPAGRLWAGTSTGLLAFDTSSLATPVAQWPATGEVRALACDPNGTVWSATDDGIFRLKDDELERFTLCDGLPSRDVRALLLEENGQLYAGTTQGLARIDTRRLTPCSTRPRIVLEAFEAGGHTLSTGEVPLRIPYADHNLSIHIRSLGWRSAAGVRYQYKLEGHDEAWSAPTRQTTRQYTHLAPGSYTLSARCVNARGLESENVVRIGFAILPPMWRTAWFAALMSVVVVATLLLGAGLLVKRAKLLADRRTAQDALRASEARYRSLVETIPHGVQEIDALGTILYGSAPYHAMLDYRDGELVGKTIIELVARDEERDSLRDYLALLVRDQPSPTPYITQNRTKGGKPIDVQVDWNYKRNAAGEVTGFISVITDITERKRAEEALLKSEMEFRTLAETVAAATFIFQEERLLYANPTAAAITGYSREELLEEPFWKVIHPELQPLVRQRGIARQHGEVVSQRYEVKILTKKGEERWVEFSAGMIEYGGRPAVLGTAFDITQRKLAEDALRESEARQGLILRSLPVALYTADASADFGATWVSEQIERISGFPPHRWVGDAKFWACGLHPDDRERALSEYAALLVKDEVSTEYRWRCADGSYHWFLDQAVLVRDESGKPKEAIGTWLDITERKRAEEALRESEEKWRSLTEHSPNYLMTLDLSGKFLFINRTAPGITKEEVIGSSIYDWAEPVDRARIKACCERVLKTGQPDRYEYHYHGEGGIALRFESHVAPVRQDGRIVGLCVTGVDVTEQRRAEEALRESEEKYRSLFEQADDSIVLVDKDTAKFAEFNDKAHKNLGYTRAEFQNLTIPDIEVGESAAEVAAHVHKITTEGADEFETQHRTKDGEIRDVLVNAKMISVAGREFFQSIWRDITGRKRAEEQAQRDQAALAHAARLATMGEMATGLAHELGQPLAAIANYLHTSLGRIRAGELDSNELCIDLEGAAAQAKRAGDIVHGIHGFVRKRETRKDCEAVGALIRKAVDLMRVELRGSGIQLGLELADPLPPVTADAIQIQQVIINLMRNSLEAMRENDAGTRRMTIRSAQSGRAWVEIAVRDSGPGLSDEGRKRAFDPFFTTKSEGMGMGLSICRSIIESHGGRLWITSRHGGEGTTFRFTLPVDRQES